MVLLCQSWFACVLWHGNTRIRENDGMAKGRTTCPSTLRYQSEHNVWKLAPSFDRSRNGLSADMASPCPGPTGQVKAPAVKTIGMGNIVHVSRLGVCESRMVNAFSLEV